MKRPAMLALLLAAASWLAGCSTAPVPAPRVAPAPGTGAAEAAASDAGSGVWYEIFVRSWYDTNGDGIGDLNGVTAKLDYLQSLGVSGIWLMPINPSPSYHGYDVTDYRAINPQYGTLDDFRRLLAEAHKRGIRVIMDLVINHTSSAHPWFLAAQDPRDPHHAWYRWATPTTDLEAPSAAGDRAWQALPDGRHYLGIFSAGMPDLDYDQPAVRAAMREVARFWLRQGVDGFRLDAAKHVYLDFASQEHDPRVLARNLAWWGEFMQAVRQVRPDAYVIGEVTADTPGAIAPWFGTLDAVFDFPLAAQLVEAAQRGTAGDLAADLARSQAAIAAAAGRADADAPFLSNHDQNRVMSQLHGDAGRMRVAAAMLLTLPGRPFVYYGEELGMRGVKPDPDLREPMRWERSARAEGQTHWKASTSSDDADVSVQAELADPDSLLARYRTLIHWREQVPALRDGKLTAFASGNRHVVGWWLQDAASRVLVLHNLSGQAQTVALADGAPGVTTLVRHSGAGTTLDRRTVLLPPYASAILQ